MKILPVIAAASAVASLVVAAPAAEPAQRPNIIFIMADDHSKESIGAYGGRYKEIAPTPGVDRLAAEGMIFHAMTATNSICVPSRAALVTGKYGHKNGVLTNESKFDSGQQTFPKLLQQAGYRTAIFGKWHLSGELTGFDHYAVIPGQGGFVNPELLETGTGRDGKNPEVNQGYLTDIITDKAIDWIKAQPKDKPFLAMVHHKAPHVPHHPADRHKTFLDGVTLPEPDNLLDDYEGRALGEVADTLQLSRLLINREKQYKNMVTDHAGRRDEGTRAIYQEFSKGYLRLVKSLDENVGRLLDFLDESGLRDNTIVIYTSDNGFFNGEHGLYNKMWMYEEALMLPLLVRWPGMVKPGSESREFASMIDFAPTFLDIAGAPIPGDLQGVAITPLLRGEEKPLRDAVYYHFHENSNVPEIMGVRTKTRKLAHYPTLKDVRWELFDLEKDPAEMNNVHDNPEYAESLREMKRLFEKKVAQFGDTVLAK
jgi:arylsulfatase A-like enzyme